MGGRGTGCGVAGVEKTAGAGGIAGVEGVGGIV